MDKCADDVLNHILKFVGNYADVAKLGQTCCHWKSLCETVKTIPDQKNIVLGDICDKRLCIGKRSGQIRWPSIRRGSFLFQDHTFQIGSPTDPLTFATDFQNGFGQSSIGVILSSQQKREIDSFRKQICLAFDVLFDEQNSTFMWLEMFPDCEFYRADQRIASNVFFDLCENRRMEIFVLVACFIQNPFRMVFFIKTVVS